MSVIQDHRAQSQDHVSRSADGAPRPATDGEMGQVVEALSAIRQTLERSALLEGRYREAAAARARRVTDLVRETDRLEGEVSSLRTQKRKLESDFTELTRKYRRLSTEMERRERRLSRVERRAREAERRHEELSRRKSVRIAVKLADSLGRGGLTRRNGPRG